MKAYTYNIESKRTPEEQLIRENEILGKVVLEIMLRFSKKKSLQKTDEEITEILSQPDWREKTRFEVGDYQEDEVIGHLWAIPWLISAREPIEIIEKLEKERKKKQLVINDYRSLSIEQGTKIKELKEKVKELTVFKEQIENLKEKTVEFLSIWHKEQEEIDDISWDEQFHSWDLEELKELKSGTEEDLNKVIFTVIEKLDQTSKDLTEAIDVAEEWKNWQKGLLNEEIVDKSGKIKILSEDLERKNSMVEQLQKEGGEKDSRIEWFSKEVERLNKKLEKTEDLLCLSNKPLPPLPKKLSKFKILKSKAKTKFQHLIEKTKRQSQEFIARIEVKSK